jgi:hypothetical protein
MQTYSTISMLPLKRQKVKTEMPFDIFSPPAPRSEDGSAGGGWGEECRAVRASKPRRLFVRTEASRASGGGARAYDLVQSHHARGAWSVGVLLKKSSDFVQ